MNKFDRNIAFTDIEMTDKYAAQLGSDLPCTACKTREVSPFLGV